MKVGITHVNAFVAIAERGNFARAAAHLGVSPSALSETIRFLEQELGVRLLNRTTRSVALTQVGERLLAAIRPALENFQAALDSVNDFRSKPAGHLRLTVPRPAVRTVIEPILAKFMKAYPAITLEVVTDSGLADIVRQRFDAGIRPGHQLQQDMIAVRVGEDARPTVVASAEYLNRHPPIKAPADLQEHNCVRQRFASGALHRWVFEKRGKSVEVAVTGTLITSDGDLALRAALDGVAVARLPATLVEAFLARKRLVAVLQDWRPASVGFFLYYPSRRQTPFALKVFIDMVKAHRVSDGNS